MGRLFYLENSIGERKDLNGDLDIYVRNISGLGWSNDYEYLNLSYGFFSNILNNKFAQGQINGDLQFRPSTEAYANYKALVDWLHQAYDLCFVYDPTETQEYYRAIEVDKISKTEKDGAGMLTCPFSFTCLTPWYKLTPRRIDIPAEETNVFRFDFTFDFVLPPGRKASSVSVTAGGHDPAGYTLEYTGLLTNPVIEVVGASTGTTYGKVDLSCTIEATDTLYYSCVPNDCYIKKITAGGVESDLIGEADITEEVFGRISWSESCDITLSSSTTIANQAKVQVYDYYRSV